MSHLNSLPKTTTLLNTIRWDNDQDHASDHTNAQHPWLVNVQLKDDGQIAAHIANNTGISKATLALSFNNGGWLAWDHWGAGEKFPITPLARISREEEHGLVVFPAIVFLDDEDLPVGWWKGNRFYQFKAEFPTTGPDPSSHGSYYCREIERNPAGILEYKGDWGAKLPLSHIEGQDWTGLVLCLELVPDAKSNTTAPIIIGELMIDP